jgi:beta-barrel assembly-enhancing protease
MRRNLCIAFFGAMIATAILCGCAAVKVASQGLAATGIISGSQAQAIEKTFDATAKAHEKFTSENEYYLGRSVTATVLGQYKPLDDAKANDYINLLGQTLAMASDKPETFGGYHFLILDTDEINAIAAPGGFILVSRGLLHCCRDEESLAAVLAHEVGHVQLAHGVKAITSARWKTAGMTAALETGKSMSPGMLSEAVGTFEACVTDVTDKIINSGYARKQEFEADKAAIQILTRVGYNPAGLKQMLAEMQKRVNPADKRGFGKTHPEPKARIDQIEPLLVTVAASAAPGADIRAKRFSEAMAGVGPDGNFASAAGR